MTTDSREQRAGCSPRRSLVGMAAFIVLLHLAGWGVLLGEDCPIGFR